MSNTPDSNRLDQESSRPSRLEVEVIVDSNLNHSIDHQRFHDAVIAAAEHRGFRTGRIGVRVTDDATIHELNRKHMGHDYPTDVISFGYESRQQHVEGELVVSFDTARDRADEIGWPVSSELLLYVVHGVLHIAGMDDQDPEERRQMRRAEQEVLNQLGIGDAASFAADLPVASAPSRPAEELP